MAALMRGFFCLALLDLLTAEEFPTVVFEMELADEANVSFLVYLMGFDDGNPPHRGTLAVEISVCIVHSFKFSEIGLRLMLSRGERLQKNCPLELLTAKLV